MLNYIWLALVVLGLLVALWTDVGDLSSNKYHNGEEIQAELVFPQGVQNLESLTVQGQPPSRLVISPAAFNAVYGTALVQPLVQNVEVLPSHSGNTLAVRVLPDESTPAVWREIRDAQQGQGVLSARLVVTGVGEGHLSARLSFPPVKFVKMNNVTNEGIVHSAKTAVELAIGLIGIMALWLGVMRVAEQSGLVAKLARLLKPVTTRLFPDVPPEHPAMGAMIMNISANMLGLANAATPLGLKAMEELNTLNRKLGTATDAMCTFLVINTSNVQLIPATVIAIRAAAGSANPAEIIGPALLATAVAMATGITTVKLLSRLPVFRRQLLPEEGKGAA